MLIYLLKVLKIDILMTEFCKYKSADLSRQSESLGANISLSDWIIMI